MNSTGPGSSGTTRSPGVRERILGLFTLRGTVTEAEPVADRMRRLRLAGPELAGLTVLPGQQIRVHVDGLTTRRTYSVWSHDPEGSLDLCVYDHGGSGPGAAWGRSVRVGDDVRFGKPEGGFVLRPGAPHHVVIGEETASVALGAVLAALPDASGVHGVVQTATAPAGCRSPTRSGCTGRCAVTHRPPGPWNWRTPSADLSSRTRPGPPAPSPMWRARHGRCRWCAACWCASAAGTVGRC